MKRLILLFFVILILSTGVNAAGLSIKSNVIDNLILVGEDAEFEITVTNEQIFTDKITFIISDLDWEWQKQFFDIAPGMSRTFTLNVKAPINVIKSGIHSVNLKVYSTSNSGVYIYEPLLIHVLDEGSFLKLEKINYPINGLNPEKETNLLKVIIKNQYDKPIDNVEINIESDIFESDYKKVDFSPAELKTEEFFVNIKSGTEEGLHDVRVLLKKGSDILLDDTKKVLVGKHSDIKEDKEIRSGFLIKKISILKRNEGSITNNEVYRYRLNSFERLFSDVEPAPSYVEKSGNDYYYIWDFDIEPGQNYLISVEVNYRDPLFILVGLILIIYLIVYLTESGISISKKVLTIKSKEGVSYMKILLLIKNKGKKEIKHARVVDRLFNAKTVPSDYGTLRPSKVNRNGDDVSIVWDIPSLIGKEERILSYRVNIGVKNRIILPRAMARYKIKNRSYVVKSNSSLVIS